MLARDFLRDYVFLTVGRVGSTSENITQRIEYVEDRDKRSFLLDVLHSDAASKEEGTTLLTLVFVETKRSADMLCDFLVQQRFPANSIHGDRTQREREYALANFRSGKCPVLVATAVAARGLDIPNVTHVINYDIPKDIDEYVHRIGRTGRAGNVGKTTAFFNMDHDRNILSNLEDLLIEANQVIPEWFEQKKGEASFGGFGGGGRGGGGGGRGRGRGGGRGGRFGATDFRREEGGGGYHNNNSNRGGYTHDQNQNNGGYQGNQGGGGGGSDWW
jgi:ATP-dependent RNA helicase DDX3X